MNKLVSVAMITYNHSKFIKEAIESVLNQTYKNIELCIGDDHSNDGTTEIIKEYQNRFPDKIKVFLQTENMGKYSLAINFNCMYMMCKGDYIAILDGDDIMLPTRIENQVKFLHENKDCIAVTHDCETFEHETQNIIPKFFSHLKTKNRTTKFLIRYGNHVHAPTVMMHNVNNKIKANTSLKAMLDWLLFIELSMLGNIGHQDLTLTRYRRHGNGVSNNLLLMSYDYYLTLSIIETKYPKYINDVIFARTKLYIDEIIHGKSGYYKAIFFPHTLTLISLFIIRVFNKIKKILLK